MAYKLLLIVFNGSGFKVVGFSRKGRPWTPIPIRSSKRLTRWVSIPFPTFTPGGMAVGVNPMKGIWQKYKVWLLIWLFYTAYGLIKSIQLFKSNAVRIEGSDDCQSTQACG